LPVTVDFRICNGHGLVARGSGAGTIAIDQRWSCRTFVVEL
jgi:hypothetical protein